MHSPTASSVSLNWSCFSSPTHRVQVQSCSLSSSFSLSTFILLSFAWIYIFLSSGQGLLHNLSCCSAMSSASEDVFLMHPWREIYSMPNYSSVILSPPKSLTVVVLLLFFSPLISVTNCLMLLVLLCRMYTYSELLYLLGLVT